MKAPVEGNIDYPDLFFCIGSVSWTPEYVQELVDGHTDMFEAIAATHNAALAAAEDYVSACEAESNKRGAEVIRLGQQLAAERDAFAKKHPTSFVRIEDVGEMLAAERDKRKLLVEALRQIATIEANDPDEVAAGLKQTQSYEIAADALEKEAK